MFRFKDLLPPPPPPSAHEPEPQPHAPPLAMPFFNWLPGAAAAPKETEYAHHWADGVLPPFLKSALAAGAEKRSAVVGAYDKYDGDLAKLRGNVKGTDGPVLSYTEGQGAAVGEAPDAEGPKTDQVTVDPTSGDLSFARTRKDAANGTETVTGFDLGETSAGASFSGSRTENGVKTGGNVGGAYDWEDRSLKVSGGLERKTGDKGAAGDFSAKGSLKVAGEDVAMSGSYSHGAGADKRGYSGSFDTEKGTYSAGYTHGKVGLGGTIYKDGFGVQASYGGIGGGAMLRHDKDRTAIGANIALSKEFSVNGMVAWGDHERAISVGATYEGIGGGISLSEIDGKMSRSENDKRVSSTITDGSSVGGNVSAVVASAEGSETQRQHHTLSSLKPEGFDSWSPERQKAWRDHIDEETRRVRKAGDLDLDAMATGDQHQFDESATLAGGASLDVHLLPGMGFDGHLKGNGTEASALGVSRIGDGQWDVTESRSSADSSDMGASGEMLFGALRGKINRKKESAQGGELGYRILTPEAKEAFEKDRLARGLMPGASGHRDLPELERLEAKGQRTFADHQRIAELRERINADTEKHAAVGRQLADGVLVTERTRSSHEASDVEKDGRVLFWGGRSHVKTSADTLAVDQLDDDGTVDHTETEARSRQEGSHAAETIEAETTTDDQGPALAFHTRQRLSDSGHIGLAQSAGNADILPGETAMRGGKEQLVDTQVALTRAEAAQIAAACNAPGSDHWEQLASRIETWKEANPLMACFMVSPDGVKSPEDFKKLPPYQQKQWVDVVQRASLGDEGNVFDSVAAIELISDADKKREAYEDLVLAHRDRGAKEIAHGDMGAEYLEFAEEMKGKSGGKLDLARDAATSSGDEGRPRDAMSAEKAADEASGFLAVLDPSRISNALIAASRGGPEVVALAAEKAKLDPVEVYSRLGDDPREMQALLEATDGTPFGDRLQKVAAMAGHMGGKAAAEGSMGRLLLDAVAAQTDAGPLKEAPRNADERRGRSLARNLEIPGTGKVVAATLIEAQKSGGAAAVQAALKEGGVTLDQVVAQLKENGDTGPAFQLMIVGAAWAR